MNIVSYVHPSRTYLPCSGAGRHMNNTLLGLAKNPGVDLKLLFSHEYLKTEEKLPINCPVRDIPFLTFPMKENQTERLWKLFSFPKMDKYLPDKTDWLFTPMETFVPISKCPLAITIFDIQAFEPHLEWSQTLQHRFFRYKWGRWVKKAIDSAKIVFTISEFTKQRMVDLLHAEPARIINIGCGVEQQFFDMRLKDVTSIKRPVDEPYFLMIGGLRKKKGGDYFLRLAKHLRNIKSAIRIVVAGISEQYYIDAAQELPNLKLLGLVGDEELPELLKGSLGLLFLSLYEGFGIPALEAMAVGVPSIVSNKASLPEVVGNAGIVVDPENTSEIASLLISLESDVSLRNQFIARGDKHVKGYSWEITVRKLVETLRKN